MAEPAGQRHTRRRRAVPPRPATGAWPVSAISGPTSRRRPRAASAAIVASNARPASPTRLRNSSRGMPTRSGWRAWYSARASATCVAAASMLRSAASIPSVGEPSANASSAAIVGAWWRRWRGASIATIVPPPSVSFGSRMTKRSPGSAATGSASRTCAQADSPAASASASSSSSLPAASAAPVWNVTLRLCRTGRSRYGTARSRTSTDDVPAQRARQRQHHPAPRRPPPRRRRRFTAVRCPGARRLDVSPVVLQAANPRAQAAGHDLHLLPDGAGCRRSACRSPPSRSPAS